MDDRSFFDRIAATWDENEVLSTPDKVKEILSYMDLREGQRVLDLGTGTGVLLPYISDIIGEEGGITAVDFSEGMLRKAEEKFKDKISNLRFYNLDIEESIIPDEYDRIILYCVYPHLHDPIDTLKWIIKVNLKTGGVLSVAFPCGPDFINNIHKEKHSESDLLPTASKLKELFVRNGMCAEVAAESENSYVVNIYKREK